MFFPYLYIAFVYFVVRIIVPLPVGRAWRIALAALVFLVCQHHQIQKWYFGTMFSPEIPRVCVILLGLLYGTYLLLFLMSLVFDLGLLLAWAVRRGRGAPRALVDRVRYALIALAALLAGIGVSQAVAVPEVRRVELAIRGLPAALEGLRMVQLTDLHISRLMDAAWVERVVARTNALQPDLIVITGDLIDGTPAARQADVAPLAGLRARHGVVASLGNHEYYFGASRWAREFERLGMRVLVNRHEVLEHAGGRLTLAGVADPVAPRFGMAGPDTARALEGAPPGLPVILLSHQPSGMAGNARAGVDAQLSGHTHGGMVRGIDRIVKLANGGYVSGGYDVDGMRLYVSNGTGLWNGFPIRLGVPAEITEFVLRKAP